MKCTAYQ